MRHSGFAVTFMPGTDEVGHVNRYLGVRQVGEQQNFQAVVHLVFGDPFDRGDFPHAFWNILCFDLLNGEEGNQSGTKRDPQRIQRKSDAFHKVESRMV